MSDCAGRRRTSTGFDMVLDDSDGKSTGGCQLDWSSLDVTKDLAHQTTLTVNRIV